MCLLLHVVSLSNTPGCEIRNQGMILGERVPLTSCPANHSLKKGQMTTEKYKDQTHLCTLFLSEPQFYTTGCPKENVPLLGTKKLGTLYYETKLLLDLKLLQQRALMSTPCSQSLRHNRCVVSE